MKAKHVAKRKLKNRAIFIDRDGTINVDSQGYTHQIEDFCFLPNAVKGLQQLSRLKYTLILITNQSGIGRGFYSLADFKKITQHMKRELSKHNVHFEKIYYCPHHPDEKCSCRKPEIGMLKQAQKYFNLDLTKSIMIGDHDKDIEAGKRAGCTTILVRNSKYDIIQKPDIIVNDLLEAALWIKKKITKIKSQVPNSKH